jgi:hypothetical protein
MRSRFHCWAATTVAAVLVLASMLPSSVSAQQSGSCSFQNGFAVMRDSVGDEIIGNCRGNERVNPYSGRVEQLTTTGLLYWRPCDNITAFTDSNIVWLDGPFGIQNRLAVDAPFAWEPSAECGSGSSPTLDQVDVVAPTPVPTQTTQTVDLPVPTPATPPQVPAKPTADPCPDKIVSARNVDLSYRNHPLGQNWRCADAYHAKFLGADMSGTDLNQANLSTADVSLATFAGAHLPLANLVSLAANGTRTKPGPNFSSADMRGVKMSASSMTQGDFRFADLSNADVSRTNFTYADLRGADLRGADLSAANFTSANLTGAYLCGANTSGAVFKDAIGVSTSCG